MARDKVVVIDDEPETVRLLKAFLELFDYEVIGTYSGASGLSAVHEHKPDILLLDLMLPDVDGYELCRELRRQPDTQTLPIIMITARISKTEVERGYAAGATVYLKKPLDLNKLVKEIETAIKRGHHAPPSPDKQQEDAEALPSRQPSKAGVIVEKAPLKDELGSATPLAGSIEVDDLETRPIPGQFIPPEQRSNSPAAPKQHAEPDREQDKAGDKPATGTRRQTDESGGV